MAKAPLSVRRLLCSWQGRAVRDIALLQSEKLPTKRGRTLMLLCSLTTRCQLDTKTPTGYNCAVISLIPFAP